MLGTTVARHMQLGPGELHASIERLRFGTLAMRVTDFSTAMRATIEPAGDIVTLGFALHADEPILITGQRFHAGTMSLFPAGRASEVRYPAGSRSVTLAVPSAVYARALAGASIVEATGATDTNPLVQVSGADGARLRDVVAAMQALAAREPELWLDGQWTANAERALLEAFLRPLDGTAPVKAGASGRGDAALAIVHEVEARLDAEPATLPSMPALCAALGVSRRTLERAFRDLLGVSPAQHLRLRALNAVREALLLCPPEPGIVTRIAIDHGFWHLGRFSLSYRRLFGERPTDTLGRAASTRPRRTPSGKASSLRPGAAFRE